MARRVADLRLLAGVIYKARRAAAPLRSGAFPTFTPHTAAALHDLARQLAKVVRPSPPNSHHDLYLLSESFQADSLDEAAAHFRLPPATRDPDALYALAFVLTLERHTGKARANAPSIFERSRAEATRKRGERGPNKLKAPKRPRGPRKKSPARK